MLDAKVYIYIECQFPGTKKVYYMSDLSKEKVYCNVSDLLLILRREYSFKVDDTEIMKIKLSNGTNLIVDLIKKEYFDYDEQDKYTISEGFIPKDKEVNRLNTVAINSMVEKHVQSKLFQK